MSNGLGKIGKSAGQKAWEKIGPDPQIGDTAAADAARYYADKAAAKKLAADAKAGKKKAEKALGKKLPSDITDIIKKPKPQKFQ